MVKSEFAQTKYNTIVMKIFIVFGLIVCTNFSGIFAQSTQTYTPVRRPAQPASTLETTPARTVTTPLPVVRNNEFGRMLRAQMDTIERLLVPTVDISNFATFRQQVGRNERRLRWQQARDTLETISPFTDTNDLAKAYYFYGKGIIFRDMAWSGHYGRDSSIIFARESIKNFEQYIQTELGNPAEVYEGMAMMFFDFLRNSSRALELLDESLALNPRQMYAYVSKVQILRNVGRMREACLVLRQALEIERLQVLEMMWTNYGCR
jgi:tetratricopeptide (TPR) repeat protein